MFVICEIDVVFLVVLGGMHVFSVFLEVGGEVRLKCVGIEICACCDETGRCRA